MSQSVYPSESLSDQSIVVGGSEGSGLHSPQKISQTKAKDTTTKYFKFIINYFWNNSLKCLLQFSSHSFEIKLALPNL